MIKLMRFFNRFVYKYIIFNKHIHACAGAFVCVCFAERPPSVIHIDFTTVLNKMHVNILIKHFYVTQQYDAIEIEPCINVAARPYVRNASPIAFSSMAKIVTKSFLFISGAGDFSLAPRWLRQLNHVTFILNDTFQPLTVHCATCIYPLSNRLLLSLFRIDHGMRFRAGFPRESLKRIRCVKLFSRSRRSELKAFPHTTPRTKLSHHFYSVIKIQNYANHLNPSLAWM